MVDYKVIDEAAWQDAAPPRLPDEWETILDLLAQGQYVRVDYRDEHERRATMVNLQRRATQRGLILERRMSNGHLFYRATRAAKRPQGAAPEARGAR